MHRLLGALLFFFFVAKNNEPFGRIGDKVPQVGDNTSSIGDKAHQVGGNSPKVGGKHFSMLKNEANRLILWLLI